MLLPFLPPGMSPLPFPAPVAWLFSMLAFACVAYLYRPAAALVRLLQPASSDELPTAHSTARAPPTPLRGRGSSRSKPSRLFFGLGRRTRSLGPVLPLHSPRLVESESAVPLVNISDSAPWASLSSDALHHEAHLVDVSPQLVDVSVPPSPAAWARSHPHTSPSAPAFHIPALSPARPITTKKNRSPRASPPLPPRPTSAPPIPTAPLLATVPAPKLPAPPPEAAALVGPTTELQRAPPTPPPREHEEEREHGAQMQLPSPPPSPSRAQRGADAELELLEAGGVIGGEDALGDADMLTRTAQAETDAHAELELLEAGGEDRMGEAEMDMSTRTVLEPHLYPTATVEMESERDEGKIEIEREAAETYDDGEAGRRIHDLDEIHDSYDYDNEEVEGTGVTTRADYKEEEVGKEVETKADFSEEVGKDAMAEADFPEEEPNVPRSLLSPSLLWQQPDPGDVNAELPLVPLVPAFAFPIDASREEGEGPEGDPDPDPEELPLPAFPLLSFEEDEEVGKAEVETKADFFSEEEQHLEPTLPSPSLLWQQTDPDPGDVDEGLPLVSLVPAFTFPIDASREEGGTAEAEGDPDPEELPLVSLVPALTFPIDASREEGGAAEAEGDPEELPLVALVPALTFPIDTSREEGGAAEAEGDPEDLPLPPFPLLSFTPFIPPIPVPTPSRLIQIRNETADPDEEEDTDEDGEDGYEEDVSSPSSSSSSESEDEDPPMMPLPSFLSSSAFPASSFASSIDSFDHAELAPAQPLWRERVWTPPLDDVDVEPLVLDGDADLDLPVDGDFGATATPLAPALRLQMGTQAQEEEEEEEQDIASPASAVRLEERGSVLDSAVEEDRQGEEEEDDIGFPSTPAATPAPALAPEWSLRAAAAPALGLSKDALLALQEKEREKLEARAKEKEKEPESLPGAFPGLPSPPLASAAEKPATSTALAPARPATMRRRSPLDAALAMQLRPGLGVGADGAWLVRFLMSFFGWFAVLVASGREFS